MGRGVPGALQLIRPLPSPPKLHLHHYAVFRQCLLVPGYALQSEFILRCGTARRDAGTSAGAKPSPPPPSHAMRCDAAVHTCLRLLSAFVGTTTRPWSPECGYANTFECDKKKKKKGGLRARLYTLINYTYSQIPRHFPIIPRLLTPFHFLPASTPPANQPIQPPTHPPSARRLPLPSICVLHMKGNS